MKRFSLTISTVSVLAACSAVGPDYHRPESSVMHSPAANASFVGGREAIFVTDPVPGEWWRLYQDPVLDDLIRQALAANTDLRVAAANIARALAVFDVAEDAKQPTATFLGTPLFQRRSAEEELRPGKPLPNSYVYGLGVNVSYQADLFGQIRRTIESAQQDVGAARAAYDTTRITVVAETTRAYLDACSAGREIDVAQRAIALQERNTALTERLFRSGRGISLDVTRSSGQEDQVRASLPIFQTQKRLALYRLATLAGQAPADFSRTVETCTQEPRLARPIPIGDGAALLKRRSDIRRAEHELASATARIGAITADLYPKISFGLSAGSVGLTDNFLKNDTFKFSIGPLMTWEFSNRTRTRARIHGAEAEAEAALARFDRVVLNALQETESALTVYARDLERRTMLDRARQKAAKAANDSDRLFRAGRQNYFPVLDANRTLIATEQALAALDSKIATDQVILFLALGGGWEDENRHAKKTGSATQVSEK